MNNHSIFLRWRESGSGGKLAVFLLWRESFITTRKKRYSRLSVGCAVLAITTRIKKDTVVCLAGCAVVSVFGSGGKLAVFLLWREGFITTGKKRYSRLSGGKVLL